MSLYNMMFGCNPFASILLALAGLDVAEIPRFRDVFLDRDETGSTVIQVFTRTGGNNREMYESENDVLANKPNAIRDYDDSYDCTYAYFEFSPLPEMKDVAEILMESSGIELSDMEDVWQRVISKLETCDQDSVYIQRSLTVGCNVLLQIQTKKIEKG